MAGSDRRDNQFFTSRYTYVREPLLRADRRHHVDSIHWVLFLDASHRTGRFGPWVEWPDRGHQDAFLRPRPNDRYRLSLDTRGDARQRRERAVSRHSSIGMKPAAFDPLPTFISGSALAGHDPRPDIGRSFGAE